MNDNSLSGPISPDIQKMTKLTFLQFHRNQFTGSIPAEVGNLNRLSESTFFCVYLLKFNARFIKCYHMLTILPSRCQFLSRTFVAVVATFDTNFLQDPMPEEVCLLRAGNLRTLTSDCLDPADPFYVECATPCCTQCF